ncbi:hypothetical protein LWX53_10500 [bacterium]|nr:hypothetical protein [bacterium]
MKPSEKTTSDLLRSIDAAGASPESSRPARYRDCIDRALGFLPASTREALALSFEARRANGLEAAAAWLATVASIFLGDYDGATLSVEAWRELRDILSADAGELDMDTLTYAMTLVVEHRAL